MKLKLLTLAGTNRPLHYLTGRHKMSLSLQNSQRMPKSDTQRIVAYTFLMLNASEKNSSFCQVLKKIHAEENWFLILRHGVVVRQCTNEVWCVGWMDECS